jgi:hypothetical protein
VRFVLRYARAGTAPEADVARVRALPGATIVDASPTMLLVDAAAEADALRELVDGLDGWVMGPEQQYGVPDARQHVDEPPG